MLLRVLTPNLQPGQTVYICGAAPELGEWNPARAVKMARTGIPLWSADVPDTLPADTEYKYIIRSHDEVMWEEGTNRTIAAPGPLWFRGLQRWKATGVAVPVFSLRTADDFGCGDFADIKNLVDWAAARGMEMIQILPVNDTTMSRTKADSYPYNAISSFALHPLYLRPQLLGELPENERERFEKIRQELNAEADVDYPAVIAAKEEYAHIIYKALGAKASASAEFCEWTAANASWLLPYCAYCVMRDRGERQAYSPGLIVKMLLGGASRSEMLFYAWLQYQLHLQLTDAVAYARSRGVGVKGDIPIGVAPHSVDAWQHPQLFNLDSSAGAPPDDFAVDGQNWGFPTYNWDKMADDNFAWWRARFSHMAQYFDAYRIDHILGFFRIWEIPATVQSGLLGHFSPALPLSADEMLAEFGFYFDPQMAVSHTDDPTNVLFVPDPRQPGRYHPRISGFKTTAFAALSPEQKDAYNRLHEEFFYRRHNDFWRQSALRKLPLLVNATPMLACAEDLGMIPACVPGVLEQERILSLEVQRMPKEFGVEISDPAKYPYMSVATTSTHDMAPLRLWLGDDTPERLQEFIRQHVDSPSMLTILPIQDWLAPDEQLRRANPAEEQINVPADPNHYWRYRLHLTLE